MGTITRSFANLIGANGPTALPSEVGGKVLQVITATDSTNRSTSSSSFVTASNTLSVTITPSSASNKIFIITNFTTTMGAGEQSFFTIFKDSTNLGHSTGGMIGGIIINSSAYNMGQSMSFLDSPSSTSALTYQVYFRSTSGTAYLITDQSGGIASITAFEIGS